MEAGIKGDLNGEFAPMLVYKRRVQQASIDATKPVASFAFVSGSPRYGRSGRIQCAAMGPSTRKNIDSANTGCHECIVSTIHPTSGGDTDAATPSPVFMMLLDVAA